MAQVEQGFACKGGRQVPAGGKVPSGSDEGEVTAEAGGVGGVGVEGELALVAVPEEGGMERRRVLDEVFELGGFPGIGRAGLEFGEDGVGDGGVDLLSEPGEAVGGDDRDVVVGGATEEFRPVDGGGRGSEDEGGVGNPAEAGDGAEGHAVDAGVEEVMGGGERACGDSGEAEIGGVAPEPVIEGRVGSEVEEFPVEVELLVTAGVEAPGVVVGEVELAEGARVLWRFGLPVVAGEPVDGPGRLGVGNEQVGVAHRAEAGVAVEGRCQGCALEDEGGDAFGGEAFDDLTDPLEELLGADPGASMKAAVASSVRVVEAEFGDAAEEEWDEAQRGVVDAVEILCGAPLLPGEGGGGGIRVERGAEEEVVGAGRPGGGVEAGLDHAGWEGVRERCPLASVQAWSARARTVGTWVMTRMAGAGWRERRLRRRSRTPSWST